MHLAIAQNAQVQVYEGFQGAIYSFFGHATKQRFRFADGSEKTVYVNSSSLVDTILSLPYWQKGVLAKLSRAGKVYYRNEVREKVAALFSQDVISEKAFALKASSIRTDSPKRSYTGLLYKIKKEGNTVGYLLGTAHSGPKEMSVISDKLRRAILKSNALFIESIPNFITMAFGIIKALINLRIVLKIIKDSSSLNSESEYGLEKSLGKVCKQAEIPKMGLEDTSTTIRGISISFEYIRERFNMEPNKKSKPLSETKYDPILTCDEEAMQRKFSLFKSEAEKTATGRQFNKISFGVRNNVQLEGALLHLRQASNHNRKMFAVGAFHLYGDSGIIAGLEKNKFQIQRVK